MSRVIKIAKGVRNHWKKSIFAAAAISYGINYANEQYKINNLMREYCAEASKYGDITQPASKQFGKVLVVLNPMADKRSSTKLYDEYCAPILHLGGLSTTVVKTESEGYARKYIEELDTLPDTIVCAGGDGTLSEVVTGLLRRHSANDINPTIAILPVGHTNTVARHLFSCTTNSNLEKVKGLADASISVIRGKTAKKDVMQIEMISEENDSSPLKPIYAVASLEWGAYRDALNKRDRYWYLGPLRIYATFLFNAFNKSLTWECDAKLLFTEPCVGCSNCYIKPTQLNVHKTGRWWSSFIPSYRLGASNSNQVNATDYSKVVNKNCTNVNDIEISTTGLLLTTSNVNNNHTNAPNDAPNLNLQLSNDSYGFDFVWKSWARVNSNLFDSSANYLARTLQILPEQRSETEPISDKSADKFFFIDNETYEVRPIKIRLLPKILDFFVL